MTAEDRQKEYIVEARDAARKLWEGYTALKALQPEWNAQDYGNNLINTEEVARAAVGSAVFDTANALETLFNAGHATNITNLL